jgi:hypothetical protein
MSISYLETRFLHIACALTCLYNHMRWKVSYLFCYWTKTTSEDVRNLGCLKLL